MIKENIKVISFFTKFKNSMQFSKVNEINFKNEENMKNFNSFIVNQELFEIRFEDKFSFIKNPFAFFYESIDVNDTDKYITKLMNNFRTIYNLTTLNLPLEREFFDLQIDDTAFEQYCDQLQNETERTKVVSSNYQRNYADNYLIMEWLKSNEFGFRFVPTFFEKIILITNKNNYVDLLLNLLNLIFFWFDIGLLDLYEKFIRVKFLINYLCKKLARKLNIIGLLFSFRSFCLKCLRFFREKVLNI